MVRGLQSLVCGLEFVYCRFCRTPGECGGVLQAAVLCWAIILLITNIFPQNKCKTKIAKSMDEVDKKRGKKKSTDACKNSMTFEPGLWPKS